MGMTKTEAAILDLAGKGLSARQIAKHGFNPSKVLFTIATFGTDQGNRASDIRRERKVRAGSQKLLRALIAAGAR